jgi:hypothetical protein
MLRLMMAWLATTNAWTPVLCVNCKFFRKDLFTEPRFGKCAKFPERRPESALVDGVSETKIYKYCITARDSDSMCGKEGKFYEDRRF